MNNSKEERMPQDCLAKLEAHCQYCQCPKEIWKPTLKTYHGDECKLYDDFSNVIWKLEEGLKPFNNRDIVENCQTDFRDLYSDITDFDVTVNEMITIHYLEGYMPRNYRPFTICLVRKGLKLWKDQKKRLNSLKCGPKVCRTGR